MIKKKTPRIKLYRLLNYYYYYYCCSCRNDIRAGSQIKLQKTRTGTNDIFYDSHKLRALHVLREIRPPVFLPPGFFFRVSFFFPRRLQTSVIPRPRPRVTLRGTNRCVHAETAAALKTHVTSRLAVPG